MTNKNPRQIKALGVALLTILSTFCCSSLLFPVILAAGQSDLSAPAGVTPHCDFAFKDAKLSVNAQNCPLANIANFLSSKAGVAVVMTADTGTEELSLKLSDVPLDDGLKQVFQQQ